jgi:Ca2+-binding EF-hand superfamily protein
MLLALGAVSSALHALQSLTSSKSPSQQAPGFGQSSTSSFDLSGNGAAAGSSRAASGCSQISPSTMSALIAAQSQSSNATTAATAASPSNALNDLFAQLDADGDGNITQSEFENALGAGGTNLAQADDVFRKLDQNGDGSVGLEELSSAMRGRGSHHHHHHIAGSGGSSNAGGSDSDPLLQALQGASSTSLTNSDGSTTTSVTYADGSKVTMTSPATKTASGSATSSYNFIEQMIAREAQAISSFTVPSLSLIA